MKKLRMGVALLGLLVLLALAMFRFLVTGRVTDRGGMENPAAILTEETLAK